MVVPKKNKREFLEVLFPHCKNENLHNARDTVIQNTLTSLQETLKSFFLLFFFLNSRLLLAQEVCFVAVVFWEGVSCMFLYFLLACLLVFVRMQ